MIPPINCGYQSCKKEIPFHAKQGFGEKNCMECRARPCKKNPFKNRIGLFGGLKIILNMKLKAWSAFRTHTAGK